jgi:hypothetical protein
MEVPVDGLKSAIFGSDMQKSVHDFGVGKTTIFELPGPCGGDQNSRGSGRAEAVLGRSRETEKGGLSPGPFRPEGEF